MMRTVSRPKTPPTTAKTAENTVPTASVFTGVCWTASLTVNSRDSSPRSISHTWALCSISGNAAHSARA